MPNANDTLDSWVASVWPLERDFESAPVDRFAAPTSLVTIRASLEFLATLGSARDRLDPSSTVMLVIPLPFSKALDMTMPDVEKILDSRVDQFFVPSLYALGGDAPLEQGDGEEFRMTFSLASSSELSTCYYRCWRGVEDRTFDWEFARALYVVSKGHG